MNIRKVGIVGAGTMGAGIAHVIAMHGYDVVLRDIEQGIIDNAMERIEARLMRAVEKGRISDAGRLDALGRISTTTGLDELSDVDLIIEAVVEVIEVKKKVFAELSEVCEKKTVFATNTSSMSVTELSISSDRPERFIGLHFFDPVHVLRLVEIIKGELTDPDILPPIFEFAEKIGKTPVNVRKDVPGFIVNRLLVPYLNEAVRLVEEGVATPEDIDNAVRLALGYPMGPFQMLDMGGIDLTVRVLEYFSKELNEPRYFPRMTLRRMLQAGRTGQRAGKGFYDYEK